VHGRGNEFCRNLCDIVYGRPKPDRSDIPEPVTINLDHYPIVLSSDLDVSHALSPSMHKAGAAHHPSLTSLPNARICRLPSVAGVNYIQLICQSRQMLNDGAQFAVKASSIGFQLVNETSERTFLVSHLNPPPQVKCRSCSPINEPTSRGCELALPSSVL